MFLRSYIQTAKTEGIFIFTLYFTTSSDRLICTHLFFISSFLLLRFWRCAIASTRFADWCAKWAHIPRLEHTWLLPIIWYNVFYSYMGNQFDSMHTQIDNFNSCALLNDCVIIITPMRRPCLLLASLLRRWSVFKAFHGSAHTRHM